MIWAALSVISLYLGVINTVLAQSAGTCTQGDASQLSAIVFSVPFFLLFSKGLWQTVYPRATTICCLPALLALIWQSLFAARLLVGIIFYSMSACQVLTGNAYDYDGHEFTYWSAPHFTGQVG